MPTNMPKLLEAIHEEACRAINASQPRKSAYLFQLEDVLETYQNEIDLNAERKRHKDSEHIAKRAQGAATVPLLLDAMHLYFTADDLDHGIAGELIKAVVDAEQHLTAGHAHFVEMLKRRAATLSAKYFPNREE